MNCRSTAFPKSVNTSLQQKKKYAKDLDVRQNPLSKSLSPLERRGHLCCFYVAIALRSFKLMSNKR
jgi:hypothetical protein